MLRQRCYRDVMYKWRPPRHQSRQGADPPPLAHADLGRTSGRQPPVFRRVRRPLAAEDRAGHRTAQTYPDGDRVGIGLRREAMPRETDRLAHPGIDAVGRRNAGRLLHRHRLRHLAQCTARPAGVRSWRRRARLHHPHLGRLPRRHRLRHPADEFTHPDHRQQLQATHLRPQPQGGAVADCRLRWDGGCCILGGCNAFWSVPARRCA
jgi:hypothetical protein